METKEILSHIDHTQLKPYATLEDIYKLCDEAVTYGTASVCIPPCYIRRVHDRYGSKLNICTVVGFPLGYSVTAAKLAETRQAIEDGAQEIDMVINISDVKNGDYDKVEQEIIALKAECGNRILKVIVETCYLTEEEKIAMCQAVTNAGADYIKTSTGFGTGGATLGDVKLFRGAYRRSSPDQGCRWCQYKRGFRGFSGCGMRQDRFQFRCGAAYEKSLTFMTWSAIMQITLV